MRRYLRALAGLSLLLLLGAGVALAQSGGSFDLSWNAIAGGGGSTTSTTFSLVGIVAQADAGAMSSPNFSLVGGFVGALQPTATATSTLTPIATNTPTRTPTAIPTPFPRPNVGIQLTPSAGTLQATITARDAGCAGGNSQLLSIQVTRLTNATALLAGPPATTITSPTTVPLTGGPAQTTLTVVRTTAGQASTVELVVTDGCGTWPTFVGGGPTAF